MNKPPLEDQLRHIADQMYAPPSSTARHAIDRRTGVLRRRRRARNAVGGAALTVLLVAGIMALRSEQRPDVDTGPATTGESGDEGSLPALYPQLDGWDVVDATESANAPWDASGSGMDSTFEGSLQVFRVDPDDLLGPTIVLQHTPATDSAVRDPLERAVPLRGGEGYLAPSPVDPMAYSLEWNPSNGDSHALIQAWGEFTDQDLVDFVDGLRPKDDDISGSVEAGDSAPAAPDDEFGFEATVLPDRIEEDQTAPPRDAADLRQVVLKNDTTLDEITVSIDDRGGSSFEANLADRVMNVAHSEQITVMDQPALLVSEGGTSWTVLWRHDDANVEMVVNGVDRATLNDLVDSIQEISEGDWDELLTEASANTAVAPTSTVGADEVPAPGSATSTP
jgi:hypothetical protein